MEVLGAAATILQVAEVALRVTSALIEYSRNTRNASTDRRLLAEEAQSLYGLLESLRARAEKACPGDPWLEQRTDLIHQFARAYDDLAATLNIDAITKQPEQRSRIKTIQAVAKWSFTKSEVYSMLERVTRLQLYANTLLLDEQYSLVEKIDNRQEAIQEEKQRSTILNWLTPLQTTVAHETISKRPEAGSGRWFLTSIRFREWQSGAFKSLWCPGIRKSSCNVSVLHRNADVCRKLEREKLSWRTMSKPLEKELFLLMIIGPSS